MGAAVGTPNAHYQLLAHFRSPLVQSMSSDATITLVIPVAAPAAPSTPPTWTRVCPDGRPVIAAMLDPLDLTNVSRIVIVTRESHVAAFGPSTECVHNIIRIVEAAVPRAVAKVCVCVLPSETKSAPETVVAAIQRMSIEGPIFVKDGDGAFGLADDDRSTTETSTLPSSNGEGVPLVRLLRLAPENTVATLTVTSENSAGLSALPSKSFVEHSNGLLMNIEEKRMVSDTICVGGYGFRSAAEFCRAFHAVRQTQEWCDRATDVEGRLFMSHVVFHMALTGGGEPSAAADDEGGIRTTTASASGGGGDRPVETCAAAAPFSILRVDWLEDWKTDAAWRRYCRSFRHVLVHFAGALFHQVRPSAGGEHGGGSQPHAAPSMSTLCGDTESFEATWKPIADNIEVLSAAQRDAVPHYRRHLGSGWSSGGSQERRPLATIATDRKAAALRLHSRMRITVITPPFRESQRPQVLSFLRSQLPFHHDVLYGGFVGEDAATILLAARHAGEPILAQPSIQALTFPPPC